MQVKIDTKEKFHVITIQEPQFAANMTAELDKCLSSLQQTGVKNIVLNMQDIQNMDDAAAEWLASTQQSYYEQNNSFVVCCLQPGPETFLDNTGLLEIMNTTPSESEAWDIVQMEEIERDFLDGE